MQIIYWDYYLLDYVSGAMQGKFYSFSVTDHRSVTSTDMNNVFLKDPMQVALQPS